MKVHEKVYEWEIQYQRYANFPTDAKERIAKIYLPLWAKASKRGVLSSSDEDAGLLKYAIDEVEGHLVGIFASAECDYNETMKAMDILEELK